MSQRSSDLKAASRTFGQGAADSAYAQHAETEQESSASSSPSGSGGHPPDLRPVSSALATPAESISEDNAVAAAPPADPGSTPALSRRLDKLEKQNFRLKLSMVALVLLVAYIAFGQSITDNIIVKQTLLESKELKLLDNEGNARLFLRMYSRVPVLQLLDAKGKPRMSLGMRFDDTPFIDLSDSTGRTRATLEMTGTDEPALRLFDEKGEPTFIIN